MAAEDYLAQDYGPPDEDDHQEIVYSGIVRETEKAVLFQTSHGKCWLPKSQIDARAGIVWVPTWVTINYI